MLPDILILRVNYLVLSHFLNKFGNEDKSVM
jgi:hypothetical protein